MERKSGFTFLGGETSNVYNRFIDSSFVYESRCCFAFGVCFGVTSANNKKHRAWLQQLRWWCVGQGSESSTLKGWTCGVIPPGKDRWLATPISLVWHGPFQNKLALEKVLYWGLSNVCSIGSNSRGPLLNFFMIHCYGVLVGPHFCTTPYGSLKHMIHLLMLLIHITHIYSCICNYITWFSYYIPPFQAIKEEEEEVVASKRSIA